MHTNESELIQLLLTLYEGHSSTPDTLGGASAPISLYEAWLALRNPEVYPGRSVIPVEGTGLMLIQNSAVPQGTLDQARQWSVHVMGVLAALYEGEMVTYAE